jgi:hypothetical protein
VVLDKPRFFNKGTHRLVGEERRDSLVEKAHSIMIYNTN